MSKPQFNENVSYRRYVELLRELHALISAGRSDEAEADEIRDQMDGPWRGLSTEEIDRVRGLSADLYSLEIKEDRPPEPLTEDGRGRLNDFQRAFGQKEWDKALVALRKAAPFLELNDVSLARGRIWSALGDLETAILFYQHAGDLALQSAAMKYKTLARPV